MIMDFVGIIVYHCAHEAIILILKPSFLIRDVIW